MKIIIEFFIFCLVLFLYLHIQFHLKTNNDLEIYEIDEPSKTNLDEICDIRQPVLFTANNTQIINHTKLDNIINNYGAFDIKIRNINDDTNNNTNEPTDLFISLPLNSSVKLFNDETNHNYISENNTDFLQETGIIKQMQNCDELFRPPMVSWCNYDILMGEENSITPFRYELNYRMFVVVTQGSAQIKLSPHQSSKYLHTINDYENLEFKSPINPWDPQPKYVNDFNKIKCLEVTLTQEKTFFIPAYWWHSIKLDKNSSVSIFRYRTYMNTISILPQLSLRMLQLQNIKRNTINQINQIEKKNDIIT